MLRVNSIVALCILHAPDETHALMLKPRSFIGKYVSMCKACGKLGGSGGTLMGNFDFGPFIRCNLVESGTVFAQTQFTIYCVIKAFIIDLHVK